MRAFLIGGFLLAACASGEGDGTAGLATGAGCTDDAQCVSGLCKEVFLDEPDRVCVSPCASQEDCPAGGEYFCQPITAGSAEGYCVPRSPAHCMACGDNSECSPLASVCATAPNDTTRACLIDCSLAGDAACPAEYSCEAVDVGGQARRLCVPGAPCAEVNGGFCDHIDTPQSCERGNETGVCIGQRECDTASQRFGPCDAPAPQCKASCSEQDAAGCTTSFCAEATAGPEHCGMCGNACPGLDSANANVACEEAMTCSFSCQGESYDVDGTEDNGCEATDSPLANHTQAAATYKGSFPCDDGSSNRNLAGTIHSDARAHETPAIDGFDPTTGAAPDWFRLFADGGACENEVVLTMTVTGSGNLGCYRLTVITSDGTYSCDTNGSGVCNINEDGTGLYSDDTDIYMQVQKFCPAAMTGSVTYTVTGHL